MEPQYIVRSNATQQFPRTEWGVDPLLKQLFEELNHQVFGDKLQMPAGLYFKTLQPKRNSSSTNGYFYADGDKQGERQNHIPSKCAIVISIEYHDLFGLERTKACLRHEMVHLYNYLNYYNTSDSSNEFIYHCGWFHAERSCPAYTPVETEF